MSQRESFGTLCSRLGVEFLCPHFRSTEIIKSGKNNIDNQCYRCKYCHKRFITNYTYKAYQPDTNQKIVQLPKEGLDFRKLIDYLSLTN